GGPLREFGGDERPVSLREGDPPGAIVVEADEVGLAVAVDVAGEDIDPGGGLRPVGGAAHAELIRPRLQADNPFAGLGESGDTQTAGVVGRQRAWRAEPPRSVRGKAKQLASGGTMPVEVAGHNRPQRHHGVPGTPEAGGERGTGGATEPPRAAGAEPGDIAAA